MFVIRKARSVIQQMEKGDGFTVGGEIGEDVGEIVVVAKLAVMDKQHDGHRGELLGAGGEAKIGLRVDLGERAEVADAVAAFERGAAIFADEHGDARKFVIRESRKNLIDLSRQSILGSDCFPSRRAY